MSKDIQIEYKNYRLPFKIVVDGIKYPNNQRNWDVIAEYNKTKNEKVLDKLVNISLDFTFAVDKGNAPDTRLMKETADKQFRQSQ